MSSIHQVAQQVAESKEFCRFAPHPSEGLLAAFRVNSRRDRILLCMDGPEDIIAYQRDPETGDHDIRPFNKKAGVALADWVEGLHQDLLARIEEVVAQELPILRSKHGLERVVCLKGNETISLPKTTPNGEWVRYFIHLERAQGLPTSYVLWYLDPILGKLKNRILGCTPKLIDQEIQFINYEAIKGFLKQDYPGLVRSAKEGVLLEDFRDAKSDSYVTDRIFFEYHDRAASIHLIYRDPSTGQIKREKLTGRRPQEIRSQIDELKTRLNSEFSFACGETKKSFKKRLLGQALSPTQKKRLATGKKHYYLSYDPAQKQFVAHFYDPYQKTVVHEPSGGVGKNSVKALVKKARGARKSFQEAQKLAPKVQVLPPQCKLDETAAHKQSTLFLNTDYHGYTVLVPQKSGKNLVYHCPKPLSATDAKRIINELSHFSVSLDILQELPEASEESEGVLLDDFGDFLRLFDEITFSTDLKDKHAVDPRDLSNDGLPTSPAQLREGLASLVERLEGQHHFLGVNGNKEKKTEFYKKLRQLASEVLEKLQSCPSIEKRQSCLLKIAEASLHCGGRCMAELYDWKQSLDDSWAQNPSSELKQTFLHGLNQYKKATVQELVAKGGNPENSHEYLVYLQTLEENGIPILNAQDVDFDDVFGGLGLQASFSSKEQMLAAFHRSCNPSSLLDFFEEFFNEQLAHDPETFSKIHERLEVEIEKNVFSKEEKKQIRQFKKTLNPRDPLFCDLLEDKLAGIRSQYLPLCFSFEDDDTTMRLTRYGTLLLLRSFEALS